MDIYYIDNDFIASGEPVIPVTDLAVLRGFGVFDFLRTYNRVPFHLRDHLLRLERSAKLLGLPMPRPLSEIGEIVVEGVRRSDHAECNIRLVITGGESADGITPGNNPRLLIMITKASALPPESYSKGVRVITFFQERYLPGAKSINYIPAIICQREAKSRGAIESIYLDRNGYLLEGTTSNFFVVIGNRVITPPCDRVLYGITRQVILDLIRNHMEITERTIHRDELRLANECFLSSSVREVTPIIGVDSITIGDGIPGPMTKKIMELFRGYTSDYGSSE